ncbi:MAG: hypothetical protein ABI167_09465 [Nitrosospira sp.]
MNAFVLKGRKDNVSVQFYCGYKAQLAPVRLEATANPEKKMQLQFRFHDKKVNEGSFSFLGYQADDTLSYT